MTVAYDAFSEPGTFTTTSPFTPGAAHAPVGTPRAVVVFIDHGTESTDLITGVTYGGVAMTRVDSAADTSGEPGRSYMYFLGKGIPTGNQSWSITHTGSATVKHAILATFTAAGDCAIALAAKIQADQANPAITIDSGSVEALRVAVVYSGQGAPATLVVNANTTDIEQFDFGAFVSKAARQTAASTGSVAIGWTAATDDVAMVAAAITEVVAVSSGDTGSGTEGTATILRSTTATETGSGADSAAIERATTSTDTGAGVDAGALVASTTSPDSAAGVDAGALATSTAAAETGSGADAAVLAAAVASADTATGADVGALAASVAAADTGAGAEGEAVATALTGADTGSGADASLGAVEAAHADTGSGADATGQLAAAVTDAETGAGVEGWEVTLNLSDFDDGAGTDDAVLEVVLSEADLAALVVTEAESILQRQPGWPADSMAGWGAEGSSDVWPADSSGGWDGA